MDKGARHAIDGALEAAGPFGEGELYHDEIGPAVYRLEPTMLTVVACVDCHYVGLIPSIPRRPDLVWECGACGRRHRLQPPVHVWLWGSRPAVVS
jgi:hypothetical protein